MEQRFVRWYVKLPPFYKILMIGSLLVGALAALFGVGTANPVFMLVGGFWLVGGPAVVWVFSSFDDG